MHASRRLLILLSAVLSSCGLTPEVGLEGGSDTPVVAAETQPESAAADESAADEIETSPVTDAELAGFGGSRFVIFDSLEGAIVFDAAKGTAFRAPGHPIDQPSGDGRTLLVRTGSGVRAIDLAARGAVLASFDDEISNASLAADGRAFAAWTDASVTLVDVTDGTTTRILSAAGDADRSPSWNDRAIYFTDARGAHLVDRSSGIDTYVALPRARITAANSAQDAFVVWNDDVVLAWRLGASAPSARVASAGVAELVVDSQGTRIAWAEASDSLDGPTWLHTLDVARTVHLRFPGKGEPCSIAAESIERIDEERGELVTDTECSPGCPSLPSQPQLVAYGFDTGAVTRRFAGKYEAPYNDRLAEEEAEAEEPRLTTPDGALVVDVTADAIEIRDAATGRRLFHAGVSARR